VLLGVLVETPWCCAAPRVVCEEGAKKPRLGLTNGLFTYQEMILPRLFEARSWFLGSGSTSSSMLPRTRVSGCEKRV
jgi:hypothetical protein